MQQTTAIVTVLTAENNDSVLHSDASL